MVGPSRNNRRSDERVPAVGCWFGDLYIIYAYHTPRLRCLKKQHFLYINVDVLNFMTSCSSVLFILCDFPIWLIPPGSPLFYSTRMLINKMMYLLPPLKNSWHNRFAIKNQSTHKTTAMSFQYAVTAVVLDKVEHLVFWWLMHEGCLRWNMDTFETIPNINWRDIPQNNCTGCM